MALFLYNSGRRGELASPDGPDEFFYGASRLARSGRSVDMLDAGEIARLAGASGPSSIVGPIWHMMRLPLAVALPGFPSVIASHLFQPAVRARLSAETTIVTTTTGWAYGLASLKAAGYLRAQVVAIAMGIFADSQPKRQRMLFGKLLRHVTLVTLSAAEAEFLRARLPGHGGIFDIPFGVDMRFWTPSPPAEPPAKPYVFAIGNDLQRDWATLVAAWSPDLPRLKIVTRLELPPLPANVEVIRGDWHASTLSDAVVRDLYRGAELVVLPLRPTIQPSGQSACLQAMACGKAVAISDVEGIWDRMRMRDGETCYMFAPESPLALAARVRAALADDVGRAGVGRRARAAVESHFNSDRMGDSLGAILETGWMRESRGAA